VGERGEGGEEGGVGRGGEERVVGGREGGRDIDF